MTDSLKQYSKNTARLAYILGLTSIISQILLLRELIVVFDGNEMAYAVILASWLFWIAVGSLTMSRFVARWKDPILVLIHLLWLIFFILPGTIIVTRFLKDIMHVQTGASIELFAMIRACFLLVAPLTFLLGSVFTLLCRLPIKNKNETARVGAIYLWEAKGAAIGGLVFSFVLIHFLSAVPMAFLIGLINLYAAMSLAGRRNKSFSAGLCIFVMIFMLYLSGGINQLDQYTRRIQWKGFDVVDIRDSVYGNLVLTRQSDGYSLFENGLLSYSTDDEATSEQSVHFSLLEHPDPQNVLLVGNGVGGALREILKHPVSHVDYAELDPEIIEISKDYLPFDVLKPLEDQRVSIWFVDARLFIKRARKNYDVMIINLADPHTAMINRYYTVEFFEECRRILKSGGILSLGVSSSENYISEETRQFLRSVHSTLQEVFADVISIPGDLNIFLASSKSNLLTVDPQEIIQRLQSRHLATKYIREYYLPFRLSPDRIHDIEDILKEKGVINTDLRPVTYFYNILFWSTRFNLSFKNFLGAFGWMKFKYLFAIPFFLFFFGLVFRKKINHMAITASIITTGFSEIVFQLIVIIAFQTLYGFAYYKISLIMTSFMIGLALGSLSAQKVMSKSIAFIFRIYRITQTAICVYPLLLPIIYVVFRDAPSTQNLTFFATTFTFLPIIAGYIGGLQYPLATHLISSTSSEKKESAFFAGSLYAADTFGAAVGALVTGALLIPLWGIKAVVYFCSAVNFAVLLLLLMAPYPRRSSARE
ncbi:MAG: fused MFS/spermidine synthase [Candidatus Omnitrophota bacterium]